MGDRLNLLVQQAIGILQVLNSPFAMWRWRLPAGAVPSALPASSPPEIPSLLAQERAAFATRLAATSPAKSRHARFRFGDLVRFDRKSGTELCCCRAVEITAV